MKNKYFAYFISNLIIKKMSLNLFIDYDSKMKKYYYSLFTLFSYLNLTIYKIFYILFFEEIYMKKYKIFII
jgi:hypothetical protein